MNGYKDLNISSDTSVPKHTKEVLIVLICIASFITTAGQTLNNTISLIANPNSLSAKEKIDFYAALKAVYQSINDTARQVEPILYTSIEVNRSKKYNLSKSYNINKRKDNQLYAFFDSSFSKISRTTATVSTNGSEYMEEFLPVLPKIPKENKIENIQMIDLVTKSAGYKKAHDFFSAEKPASFLTNDNIDQAFSLTDDDYNGLWGLRLSKNELKTFLLRLRKNNSTLFDKLYYFYDEVEYGEIIIEDTSNNKQSPTIVDSLDSKNKFESLLQNLDSTDFNYMYVLDMFDPTKDCMHGNKVMNVIKEVLGSFIFNKKSVKDIEAKLLPIPVNYFENRSFINGKLDTLLLKITGSNTGQISGPDANTDVALDYKALYQQIGLIKKAPNPAKEKVIPDFLLPALFKYCTLNPKADIITTSIYARLPLSKLGVRLPNCRQLLFCAADNEEISIDTYYKKGDDAFNTEPLSSYYENRKNAGAFIVGGFQNDSLPFGMYSTKGDGISVVGHVTNWNSAASKEECINTADLGNSFATPETATLLWIAKAMWRKAGYSLSSYDSKIKCLLASDIQKAYAGRFGSAGLISYDELFMPSSKYTVLTDGSYTLDSLSKTSKIRINQQEYKFGKQNLDESRSYDVVGLCFKNGETYALFDQTFKWEKIDENGLEINLVLSNGETYRDVNLLKSKYSKIVNY